MFLSLFQFGSAVDSSLYLPHQNCFKREKDDMIITGKASVYSDKMTSSSGRCQMTQGPGGTKITAIKVGKPGIIGEMEGQKEGRLLMPPSHMRC